MNLSLQQGVLVERSRISSIDIARGVIMVIMALDHSRHFFDGDSLLYEPTDLAKTTPFLFFTRWITHFCAPGFVLLAGTSIRINMGKKPIGDLSTFLITRGLWLIFLEVVVIRFLIIFNWYYDFSILQVIWAIGMSMIVMALFIRLKDHFILAIALIIIFGHNFLDGVSIDSSNPLYVPALLSFKTGYIAFTETAGLYVGYPFVQWLGIMMLGYVLGKWFSHEYHVLRPTYLLIAGISMVLLFIVLRYINIYGDPRPWEGQKDMMFTILSFLNCEKYPPSLLYILMTIGPLLIAMALLETVRTKVLAPLEIFGRVPLFYYVLHFLFLHLAALLYYLVKTGKSFSDLDFHAGASFGGINPDIGHDLVAVYVAWIAVVVILFPLCYWYSNLKRKKKSWWLSYV
jgi:uncharacterized membrane protein